MRNPLYIASMALLASVAIFLWAIPGTAAEQPGQGQAYAPAGSAGAPPGGPIAMAAPESRPPVAEAFVIGADPPENCLRIRRGPSPSYQVLGCAKLGDRLRLTGVFSGDNKWAQLEDNGWVYACQIRTDFKPPGPPIDCGRATPAPQPRVQRTSSDPSGFGEVIVPRYIGEDRYYGDDYWRYRRHSDYWQGHGHGHGHKK
jgi:hypothetical protein